LESKFGQWLIKKSLTKMQKKENKKPLSRTKSDTKTNIAPLLFASLLLMPVGVILILTLILYVPGIILLAAGLVLLLVELL